jgi:hypothetical protein
MGKSCPCILTCYISEITELIVMTLGIREGCYLHKKLLAECVLILSVQCNSYFG